MDAFNIYKKLFYFYDILSYNKIGFLQDYMEIL